MISYTLPSGVRLTIRCQEESYSDPGTVSVEMDPGTGAGTLLTTFVHDAAIKWKAGEVVLFKELLGLLLQELRRGSEWADMDEGKRSLDIKDGHRLELREEECGNDEDEYNGIDGELSFSDNEAVKLEPSIKFEIQDGGMDKFYQCPDCSEGFLAEAELESHFLSHHSADHAKFRCYQCGSSFHSARNVRVHISSFHHKDKSRYQCTHCDYSAKVSNSLRKHLAKVHGEKPPVLKSNQEQQDKEDEGKRDDTDESRIFKSKPQLSCGSCPEKFLSEKELEYHVTETNHATETIDKCDGAGSSGEQRCRPSSGFSTVEEAGMAEKQLEIHKVEPSEDQVLRTTTGSKEKMRGKRKKCDRCEQTFCSNNSLKTHIRIIHENIKDYTCLVCQTDFATVSGVKKHLQHHHELQPREEHFERKNTPDTDYTVYRCTECKSDEKTLGGLTEHVVKLHPTKPHLFPELVRSHGPLPWSRSEAWERGDWNCPICPSHLVFKTETLNGMVSHVKLGHPDSIMCWVCGLSWTAQEGKLVYEHMVEVHPLKSMFACQQCGVYNASKKLLGNHKKIHRMEELQGPLNVCDLCDYVTPRPDLMAKHRFSHRASKHFMCDDCGKVLRSRTALATHAKLHNTAENRNQCTICFKNFTQRGYLKTHMNTHSDNKPWSCEFCAMTFIGATNLSQHRKRAHGDLIGESPQLSCPLCAKRFWIPSELKYHVERVHEGKRDFKCPECFKRFADKKNLKKHLVNIHKLRQPPGTQQLQQQQQPMQPSSQFPGSDIGQLADLYSGKEGTILQPHLSQDEK